MSCLYKAVALTRQSLLKRSGATAWAMTAVAWDRGLQWLQPSDYRTVQLHQHAAGPSIVDALPMHASDRQTIWLLSSGCMAHFLTLLTWIFSNASSGVHRVDAQWTGSSIGLALAADRQRAGTSCFGKLFSSLQIKRFESEQVNLLC